MTQYRTLLGTLLATLLLAGCSSMERLISPELRYGQLYSLHDALQDAARQCDAAPRQRADYWAVTAAANLQRHRSFLTEEEVLRKTDELLSQLYALRWQAGAETGSCDSYRSAGQVTAELLALLNAPATLTLSQR